MGGELLVKRAPVVAVRIIRSAGTRMAATTPMLGIQTIAALGNSKKYTGARRALDMGHVLGDAACLGCSLCELFRMPAVPSRYLHMPQRANDVSSTALVSSCRD